MGREQESGSIEAAEAVSAADLGEVSYFKPNIMLSLGFYLKISKYIIGISFLAMVKSPHLSLIMFFSFLGWATLLISQSGKSNN